MSEFFSDWEQISVANATTQFYQKINADGVLIGFDSSLLEVPGPMINAALGLAMLKNGDRLIMINHRFPAGLIPKIEGDFDHAREDLADGKVKMEFKLKPGATPKPINAACHG